MIAAVDAEVVILNDSTFERTTQANSGMTTGSWFVKFYAPWCGHCRAMAPAWEELAEQLASDDIPTNVAKVDVTKNNMLASQFNIRSFPTLKLLHRSKLYSYRGRRDAESMAAFARGGFETEAEAEAMPAEATYFSIAWDAFADVWREMGRIYWLLPWAIAGLFALFGYAICWVEARRGPPRAPMEAAAMKEAEKED